MPEEADGRRSDNNASENGKNDLTEDPDTLQLAEGLDFFIANNEKSI